MTPNPIAPSDSVPVAPAEIPPNDSHCVERRPGVERLDAVMRASEDAILIYDLDGGEVLEANPTAASLFGRSHADTPGATIDALISGAFTAAPALLDTLLGAYDARAEIDVERAPGTNLTLAVRTESVPAPGGSVAVAVLRDVSASRAAERMLRESEERYGLVAYGANDGLWDWQLIPNQMFFSPRWKGMLGYDEGEIGESPNELFARVHPDDAAEIQRRIASHLEGETPNFEIEIRILHKSGEYRWMLVRGIAVRNAEGRAYRMAGSQSDITERRQAQEQLVRKALYDSLTGLPNRSLFTDRLRHAAELSKRRPEFLFAVLFLDLDRFKVVNDSLGHLAGDELLVQIARRLEASVRPTDTFARLGGDEFAILLEGISSVDDARHVADRINDEFQKPFRIAANTVHTTASVGIAVSSEFGSSEDLLREADMAMYRAKAEGRARYEVYESGAHVKELTLLHLENDMRGAIDRGEFCLYYQPIVALRTGTLRGFEALVRWMHPERGLVPPNDFISIAEESGLIVPLGGWVLNEACRQMSEWNARYAGRPPLTVSVNLSSKQFSGGGVIDQVRAALGASRLRAGCLKLEVTESVLMENAEATLEALEALKAIGPQLAIDDFGTGYSSLSYLHRFPFDELKIDRSFVRTLGGGRRKDVEIVRAIIGLALNLDLDVVAEGIETEEQRSLLGSMRCPFGQGYLFSRPEPTHIAEGILATAGDNWTLQ